MPTPASPSRRESFDRLAGRGPGGEPFDLVVIGGGATGLGVALDAAARGFSVALVEAEDFAKGTSSRATKLVHGGVRYLAQGNVSLVREALRERRLLLDNAPHLAGPLPFVLPTYGWQGRLWQQWFYGLGLAAYGLLAGQASLGPTRLLGRSAALEAAPGLEPAGLVGGVAYWDGQFDDARLAVALARSAQAAGATVVNYCRVTGLVEAAGRVAGVVVEDRETGRQLEVPARAVVNATGVWVDAVRKLDDPAAGDLVAPSQGVHLVVDREFFPGERALIVPKTSDGRVLFAVPWLGRVILGTTDTPRHDLPLDPRPLAEEVGFILAEAGRYLARPPATSDIRSAWAGLRPLVKPAHGDPADTKRISREHTILVSPHGLVTVTGGKWTTYRAMAEDVLTACFRAKLLPARPGGVTAHLRLVGAPDKTAGSPPPVPLSAPPGLHLYGSESPLVAALPGADREILPGLSEAMVRFAVRHELARTVEDVLARRSRWLFLDAAAAARAAEPVAAILAEELFPERVDKPAGRAAGEQPGRFDPAASAAAFRDLAGGYLPG
jgi:glycerol-3-phosphate dehydrogenase